jgi:hypothetical protein
MLAELVFLIKLAGVAVVFADVLVRPGMLLEPVQRWAREAWRTRWNKWLAGQRRPPAAGLTLDEALTASGEKVLYYASRRELDEQWWWPPLWGCYKCVAGQWGFWAYLIRYHGHYNLFEHLAFTAFTIIAAIIISKWTQQ